MKRIISWLKNIRPVKIFTVFVAGIFLVLTQACNNPSVAGQPSQPRAQAPNIERYDPTKDYPLSSPRGGFNNFSDVDPRAKADEKAAEQKAEALSKNAAKNIEQKGIDSREQYVKNYQQGTPLGERVKSVGEGIGSSAEEVGEGVVTGTQRGIENIKDNIQNATKGVQRVGEDAGQNIQRTAEDAADTVNRKVKNLD